MLTDFTKFKEPAADIIEGFDGMDENMKNDILNELKPKWNNQGLVTPNVQLETLNTTKMDKKESTIKVEKKNNESNVAQLNIDPDLEYIKKHINELESNHKYEYKTILVNLEHIEIFEDELNKLGEECWEMVNFEITHSILPDKARLFCILKRNKQ